MYIKLKRYTYCNLDTFFDKNDLNKKKISKVIFTGNYEKKEFVVQNNIFYIDPKSYFLFRIV